MNYPRYDYSGHRVAVIGGTQGTGLAIAHTFADAGADVVVTGAQHLTGFYDADLSRFHYRQVALEHQESIVDFAGRVDRVDVLVVAGGPEVASQLPASDREFLAEASRLGLVGPVQIARRLRHQLSASAAQGGGAVVLTPTASRWWSVGTTPTAVTDAAMTAGVVDLAETLGRHGVRANACLTERPAAPAYHVQIGRSAPHTSGTLMARPRRVRGSLAEATRAAVVDVVQFLGSAGAAGITGQTLRVG
ncbi:SDR family oxidoreductase [Nocardioides zeae]|uniref:SDR family oxidoreductase n=1 Tax=Nocardioides imazamoxiresistens TaxID=3231893 RepID=A0ABU3Q0U9_9ACTN|nr:SDR family oxidoreductase [Nocardioides zeae]MDT9595147.1 SDR family oxidoreductase [Nocardioides zeae]